MSGQTKTKTFNITSPTKFLELDLGEDNLIEVISCVDGAGQNWYEVDYLAQDKILKQTHYTDDPTRTSAYDQGDVDGTTSPIPIPYVAEYIKIY